MKIDNKLIRIAKACSVAHFSTGSSFSKIIRDASIRHNLTEADSIALIDIANKLITSGYGEKRQICLK